MPGHTDKKMGSGGMDIPAISREEQVMRELPKGNVTTTDEELKRLNINVIRPDINKCFADFSSDNRNFLYALGAIKNVGFDAISRIVEERNQGTEKPWRERRLREKPLRKNLGDIDRRGARSECPRPEIIRPFL